MRLIDADALRKEFLTSLKLPLFDGSRLGAHDYLLKRESVVGLIMEAPTIDAEPVRHGRWIETNKPGWVDGQYYETPRLVCPFCTREAAHYSVEEAEQGGRVTTVLWLRTDYCPHCGAKMDGGDPND